MANVVECSGCSGSVQHGANLTNAYDGSWSVFVNNDSLCVRLVNSTSTNVSVNVWVEDSAGNGPLSDPTVWVQVPPGTEKSVCFSAFGYQADQVTPISQCILHPLVHNDDSENEGVEIYHEVY